MPKTVTLRLDDDLYNVFKEAAQGEHRSISNFLEYASLSYLTSNCYVSDEEMAGILNDRMVCADLKIGLAQAKKGKYKIVK